MRNSEVARVFQDVADLLELKGENVFKIHAYQRTARAIEHYPKELKIMIEEGEGLQSIPGVGEAIARKTTELVTTGRLGYYENLKAEFPQGMMDLLAIPGVGPKTANKLSSQLGISSVDELERAINDGRWPSPSALAIRLPRISFSKSKCCAAKTSASQSTKLCPLSRKS